jgi:hypothetical protein
MDMQRVVKSAYDQLEPTQLLRAPVTALLGVADEAAAPLQQLGIDSVFDLATAAVFNDALRLSEPSAALHGLLQQGFVPQELAAGWIGTTPDPAQLPLHQLRGLTGRAGVELGRVLGATSVRDLADWPPFRAARALAGLEGDLVGPVPDPEVPPELVPRFNEHATEKSFYAVYAVDESGDRRGSDLVSAVDLTELLRTPLTQAPRTGHVLRYEQSWTPVALTLGNLLHSLALAPGESTRIAMVDWSRRQGVSTVEDVSQLESLSHTIAQARSINEVTRAVAREAQSGFSEMNANSTVSNSGFAGYGLQNAETAMNAAMGGAGAGGSAGAVGGGIAGAGIGAVIGGMVGGGSTWGTMSIPGLIVGGLAGAGIGAGAGGLVGATAGGAAGFLGTADFGSSSGSGSNSLLDVVTTTASNGTRDVAAETLQNIQDRTHQHSSSARSRRASIVQEISQSETERLSTRVVTNYNHMHALTIQYFEVVQLYAVQTRLVGRQRCLYVPIEPVRAWSVELVRLLRPQILAAALTPELVHALLSTERSVLLQSPTAAIAHAQPRPPSAQQALQRARRMLDSFVAADPWNGWRLPGHLRVTWLNLGNMADGPESGLVKQFVIHLHTGGTIESHAEFETAPGKLRLRDISHIELKIWPQDPARKLVEELDDRLEKLGFATLTCRSGDPHDWHDDDDTTLHVPLVYARTPAMVDASGTLRVTLLTLNRAAAMATVIEHLNENSQHYTSRVLRSRRNPLLPRLLAAHTFRGEPLLSLVDQDPVAVTGNDLVFMLRREPTAAAVPTNPGRPGTTPVDPGRTVPVPVSVRDGLPELGELRASEIVPVGTGGVFAEAIQGRANAAERLDIGRFWNWHESPIPIVAPEIAPLQAGSRAMGADVRPGGLDAAAVTTLLPAGLPAPQGMTSVLAAVSADLFRDMSGIAQTAQLAQTALEQAVQGAVATGGQAAAGLQQGLQFTKDLAARIIDMNSNFANTLVEAGMGAAGMSLGGGGAGGLGGNASRALASPASAGLGQSALGALLNKAGQLDARAPQAASGAAGNGSTGGSGPAPSPAASLPSPQSAGLERQVLQSAAGLLGLQMLQPPAINSVGASTGAVAPGGVGSAGAALQARLKPLLDRSGDSDEQFDRALQEVVQLAEEAALANADPWPIYQYAMQTLPQAWNLSADRAIAQFNAGDTTRIERIDRLLAAAAVLPALRGPTQPEDLIARLDVSLDFVEWSVPAFSDGGAPLPVSGRLLQRLPGGQSLPLAGASVRLESPGSVEQSLVTTTDAEGRFSFQPTHGLPDPDFAGVHRFTGFHDLDLHVRAASAISPLIHAQHSLVVRGRLAVSLISARYTDDDSDALAGSVVLAPLGRQVWLHFIVRKGGQAFTDQALDGPPTLTGEGLIDSYTTLTGNDGLVSVIYSAQGASAGVAYIAVAISSDDGQVAAGRADLQLA